MNIDEPRSFVVKFTDDDQVILCCHSMKKLMEKLATLPVEKLKQIDFLKVWPIHLHEGWLYIWDIELPEGFVDPPRPTPEEWIKYCLLE